MNRYEPPEGTRRFSLDYENPDDTGFSPYPVAPPGPVFRRRASRAPMVLAGLALLLLVLAALLAAVLVFRGWSGPSAPALPATTPPPTLSKPVEGADGLGFIGHTARCDPGQKAAAVLRTSKSLVVVCQDGPQNFYYRGERLRDGANIELPNAVRTSGGFDVTNPSNGVRYEVRPQSLTIISGGHTDSAEPVLQYATGG